MSIINGKVIRKETSKEKEVLDWCFGKRCTPDISKLSDTLSKMEPVDQKLFDKVVPFFLADLKQERKRKRLPTLWTKELEAFY